MKTHQPCPDCNSSDGLTIYEDGSYCFVCETKKGKRSMSNLSKGKSIGFRERNISTSTVVKFGVTAEGTPNEITKHYYPYKNQKGEHVANKVRILPKTFTAEGKMGSNLALFGQDVFPKGSGRSITIYEGELDAMAGYELTGSLFPSVSLPNGSSSAESAIKANLEYLESFDKVVLCFDNDEAGKKAVEKVVGLFSVGKCKIMHLEHKDACEYLILNKHAEFKKAWFKAEQWMPEDVVCSNQMLERIQNKKKVESVEYPWAGLNEMTYGIRKGELVMFTAKTGRGKTQFLREIEYHIHKQKPDSKIGTLFLEEQPEESAEGLMSIHANKPFHLPDTEFTVEEHTKVFNEVLGKGNFYFYENFGEADITRLINRIRYYVKGLDCEYIILDHLSIIVSGQTNGDDRSALDEITTKLKALTVELNVAIIGVVHLNRQGQIRGSAGVEQLSNTVIHLERDVENEDPLVRNITKVTVWKNRFAGRTGVANYLAYIPKTGRIIEIPPPDNVNEMFKEFD